MYRVETWNRFSQRWEPAYWINPRPDRQSALTDQHRAFLEGSVTYTDSRVTYVSPGWSDLETDRSLFAKHEPMRPIPESARSWECTCGGWSVFSGNWDFVEESFAKHLETVATKIRIRVDIAREREED